MEVKSSIDEADSFDTDFKGFLVSLSCLADNGLLRLALHQGFFSEAARFLTGAQHLSCSGS